MLSGIYCSVTDSRFEYPSEHSLKLKTIHEAGVEFGEELDLNRKPNLLKKRELTLLYNYYIDKRIRRHLDDLSTPHNEFSCQIFYDFEDKSKTITAYGRYPYFDISRKLRDIVDHPSGWGFCNDVAYANGDWTTCQCAALGLSILGAGCLIGCTK